MTGTSSFGMSGVNAHAIFCGSAVECGTPCGASSRKMLRTRHWPSPEALYMVGQATITEAQCSFHIDLALPDFSWLGDHKVRPQRTLTSKNHQLFQQFCVLCRGTRRRPEAYLRPGSAILKYGSTVKYLYNSLMLHAHCR